MFCPKCGSQNGDDLMYCRGCGVDLGSVLDPTIGIPGGLAPVFDLLKLVGA